MKAGAVTTAIYTSPHATPELDPEPALLALINSAAATIEASIYALTLTAVRDALIAAHIRGVTVQIAADATEAASTSSLIPSLVAAGLDVHVWGSKYVECHAKSIVVDGKACANGSYNWTNAAEKTNYEVFEVKTGVEVTRGGMAGVYTAQIQDAYSKGKPVAISTGGTP